MRGGNPRREGEGTTEVVFRVVAAERSQFGGDRGGIGAQPLECEIKGVAAVIHRDPASREFAIASPIGLPFRDSTRVCRSERLQGDEVDRTDGIGLQDAPHFFDDGGMTIVVARKKDALRARRVLHHRAGLVGAHREGFFAKHVQSARERSTRNIGMGIGWSRDVHEIEAGALVFEQGQVIWVSARAGKCACGQGSPFGANVRNGTNLGLPGGRATLVFRPMPALGNEAIPYQRTAKRSCHPPIPSRRATQRNVAIA